MQHSGPSTVLLFGCCVEGVRNNPPESVLPQIQLNRGLRSLCLGPEDSRPCLDLEHSISANKGLQHWIIQARVIRVGCRTSLGLVACKRSCKPRESQGRCCTSSGPLRRSHQHKEDLPAKPVACNCGPLSITNGLLWGIVAHYFGLLGSAGTTNTTGQKPSNPSIMVPGGGV